MSESVSEGQLKKLARAFLSRSYQVSMEVPEEKKEEARQIIKDQVAIDEEQGPLTEFTFLRLLEKLAANYSLELLFQIAQDHFGKLVQNHPEKYTDEEIRFLSAMVAGHDMQRMDMLFKVEDPKKAAQFALSTREKDWEYELVHNSIARPYILDLPPAREKLMEWHRSIHEYPHFTAKPLATEIPEYAAKKNEPLVITDLGFGGGRPLRSLRDLLTGEHFFVGTGHLNHWPKGIDRVYVGPFEILPGEWTNSSDVVVSNMSFAYSVMPRLAVREAIRIAKPGALIYLDISQWYNAGVIEVTKYAEKLLGLTKEELHAMIVKEYSHFHTFEELQQFISDLGEQMGYTLTAEQVETEQYGSIAVRITKEIK